MNIETREQTGIGKAVFKALNEDLDIAAQSASAPKELRIARDNYRQNFQAIDQLRKSAIGQYLGLREQGTIAPEHVADRLVGMKPTQLKSTFALLGKADPELAGTTKRYMIERAMYAAEPSSEKIAERLGAGQIPEDYSPARLLGNLAKSPVLDVLDPNEKLGVQMLNAAFKRLANRGGTEGSPTAPLSWAFEIAKNISTATLAGDLIGAVKTATMILGPTRLAEAITSRDATKALYRLTQPNLPREAAIAALTTLGLMTPDRLSRDENVRPFGEPPMPAETQTGSPQ